VPTTAPVFFLKNPLRVTYGNTYFLIFLYNSLRLTENEKYISIFLSKVLLEKEENLSKRHVPWITWQVNRIIDLSILGYVVALDMTARDIQDTAKTKDSHGRKRKGTTRFAQYLILLKKEEIRDPHQLSCG